MIRCLRAWSPVVIVSDHAGSVTVPFLQDPIGEDAENKMVLLIKSHESANQTKGNNDGVEEQNHAKIALP